VQWRDAQHDCLAVFQLHWHNIFNNRWTGLQYGGQQQLPPNINHDVSNKHYSDGHNDNWSNCDWNHSSNYDRGTNYMSVHGSHVDGILLSDFVLCVDNIFINTPLLDSTFWRDRG
jgi:hypothetical protein